MRTLPVVWTLVLTLLLITATHAESAQEPNPLFLEASGLLEQLSASSLDDNVKTAFRKRFESLEQEQQELWTLAGQVDGGECQESCIELYNSRISAWESNLNSFNDDARRFLKNQPVDPDFLAQCLRDCEAADDARRRKCDEGPIEESVACKKASWELKIDCTNTKCYGITTPVR